MQAYVLFKYHELKCKFIFPTLILLILATPGTLVMAGGGLVLEADKCILEIEFYSAHFTVYQPDGSGNKQFCRDLPHIGNTIFVLDYLHQSLKEVPVDFRIIKNTTGQGRFAKLKNLEQIENIEKSTVFYQPPLIQSNASFKVEYEFVDRGEYIGIVTAGHPDLDTTYTAIFPFEVGASNYVSWIRNIALLALAAVLIYRKFMRPKMLAAKYTATTQGEVT